MARKFIKLKKFNRSKNDYRHVFGVNPILPTELLFLTPILTQDAENCTAFSSVAVREAMTDHVYVPELQWKQELQFQGVMNAPQGVDFKTPLAVGVKTGFWPVLSPPPMTAIDKASAYIFVHPRSGQDWFDAIRQTINQIQAPLLLAVDWLNDWDATQGGVVPATNTGSLGGHCTKIAGFKTINGIDCLVIQNSWGIGYGDNGLFYFPRGVVNANFGAYGVAYFSDDQNLQVQRLGFFQALLQNIIALYATLISSKQGIPPPTQYYWSTPIAARHSVRVICDEEGLSWNDKNILDACVHVESDYNPLAEHMNRDKTGVVWSTDYGIAQINDYFNIGAGKPFPSSQYVLDNPEACIRWMAQQWKAGNQHLWASYTSKKYLQYLPKVVTPSTP